MSWICFVGGKTGGHILPGLTLSLEDARYGNNSVFITTNAPLDMHIMRDYPHVDAHKPFALSGNYAGLAGKLRCIVPVALAFVKALSLLWHYKPIRVVSTGGLISLPVCYAAWLLRIPVIVYELNAIPGRATRVLAWCATEMRVCFLPAQRSFKKSVLVEYPVRFTERDRISKSEARNLLGLDENSWTLFISGGSQGSRFINNFIMRLLMSVHDVQVIHQTGIHDVALLREWYKNKGIPAVVFAYRADINVCYAAADRIIARAGAGSLFEILFFKVPSLIIPLITKITDHQCDNAYAMRDSHPSIFMVSTQDEIDAKRESIEKFLLNE